MDNHPPNPFGGSRYPGNISVQPDFFSERRAFLTHVSSANFSAYNYPTSIFAPVTQIPGPQEARIDEIGSYSDARSNDDMGGICDAFRGLGCEKALVGEHVTVNSEMNVPSLPFSQIPDAYSPISALSQQYTSARTGCDWQGSVEMVSQPQASSDCQDGRFQLVASTADSQKRGHETEIECIVSDDGCEDLDTLTGMEVEE